MLELLEPWETVDEERARALEAELARELASRHVLAGKQVRAVAARMDCDDVLFEVVGAGYAVVHLTWSQRSDAERPMTQKFASLEDWAEIAMRADHDEYTE